MRMRLSPLTTAEQQVAAQNAYIINRFLSANRLPAEDWYDVVVFRYLLTVKRWFAQPDLYRYNFNTLAWNAMRSAVGHERDKRRQMETVSLDDPVPGTDDLTWADLVTEKNLEYIPYL